jgi:hypothetical protein
MKSDTGSSTLLVYVEAMWAAKWSRVYKNGLKMNYGKIHDFIIISDEF